MADLSRGAESVLVAMWSGSVVVVRDDLQPYLEPQHSPGVNALPVSRRYLAELVDRGFLAKLRGGGSSWFEVTESGEAAVAALNPFAAD